MRDKETARRRHPHKALTAKEAQAMREPGRHADGGGLYLLVAPGGSKSWMLRTVVMGTRRDIGLGSLTLVSLAEAREEARRLRKIARDDGDPLDALVLGQEPLHPLSLVDARAIGVLRMRDEKGLDDKIIAVSIKDPAFNDYTDHRQLPQHLLREMTRFFEDYKVLEHKQVVVEDILGPADALKYIREAIDLYQQLRRGELKAK